MFPLLIINEIFILKMTLTQYFILWFLTLAFEIVFYWLYNALLESSKYKGSLGKMALKIVVVDAYGNKISFGKASGRFFAKFLSAMICYFGFIMTGFTKKKQGLHDLISDTYVVKLGYEHELSEKLKPEENELNV